MVVMLPLAMYFHQDSVSTLPEIFALRFSFSCLGYDI